MELEFVDVVDQDDKLLRTIPRKSATNADILRVAGVYILNKEGEIILQLRSEKSFRYPLYWDCTGGGHVGAGEDYESAAKRELFEETGIKTDLVFLGKHLIKLGDGRTHLSAFFKGSYDRKITIDPKELKKVQSFSLDQIRKMIDTGEKIHPDCLFGLERYFLEDRDGKINGFGCMPHLKQSRMQDRLKSKFD